MILLFHKLSYDILALALLSFGTLIVSEIVFPGFLTQFVSFTQIIIVLVFTLLCIAITTPQQKENTPTPLSRRALVFWTMLTIILTTLTMQSFALWEIVLLLTFLGTLLVFLLRNDPKKNV